MLYSKTFLQSLHRRLAEISVTSSSLRNQGNAGLIAASRNYLYNNISLDEFFRSLAHERSCRKFLDRHTVLLDKHLPGGGRFKRWGAARKILNLFFRELVYNKILCDEYGVPRRPSDYNRILLYLEVPLDKDVATGILRNSTMPLPQWIGVKYLLPEVSKEYQDAANLIAESQGIPRIHLDLDYWRPTSKSQPKKRPDSRLPLSKKA